MFPTAACLHDPHHRAHVGPGADRYLWLEDVEGERALAWATERSRATLDEFEALPLFAQLEDAALDVLASSERLAYPSIRGDHLYNFWTDSEHPRGIYRRTTWPSYLSGSPSWETVLDIDALSEAEGTGWAFAGISCLAPRYRRCLVNLSRGGADATEIREFDLEAAAFVDGGFFVAEAKNGAAFIDERTVLVATDFGGGSVTTSGYPRQVRLWKRGQALAEAELLFEGSESDMAVFPGTWEIDGQTYGVVSHLQTIFESVQYLVMDGELVGIQTPPDASTFVSGDQLVVRTVSPWTVGGRTIPRPRSLPWTSTTSSLARGISTW